MTQPVNAEVVQTLERWAFDPLTGKLVFVLVGLVLIVVLMRLVRRAAGRYLHDNATRYQARKATTFFGYLAAMIFVALVFSDKLGGFTVAFGVAGAGVAFALQEVIASAAGWVAVSFGGFYRVGDRVQLGGIKGDVIDIGMLRTTIMQIGEWVNGDQYNGRIVRVANSFVFKEPVFNYSGEFPFLWDEIMVPVKYGSDYRLARELIGRVAEEVVGEYARAAELAWEPITRRYLIEKASVLPAVTMTANQNWIEFTLRYVVDYKARRTTRDRLFGRILEEIDLTEERVGIAASTLNIEKLAPLEVHLTRTRRPGA
jgi:small-conductance mechanosensitive channel